MNKGKKHIKPIIGTVIGIALLFAQGSGYLSQKLMVENDIRDRVKEALSKVIDSHKYVINVDVDLEILDEVNEQITVFAPRESGRSQPVESSPAERTAEALVKIQNKMVQDNQTEQESYSIGLPIPGFEVDVVRPKTSSSRPLTESAPISPKTMAPMDSPSEESAEEDRDVVDKVLSRKRPSRAEILPPSKDNGLLTLPIGLSLRESSPVKMKFLPSCAANKPISNLIVVPEFPQFSISFVSFNPSRPIPEIVKGSSFIIFGIFTPNFLRQSAVESGSSEYKKPSIVVSPLAMLPIIRAL